MRKFQDFSVIQILREINFGESRSSKPTYSFILGTMNFTDLVNFSLQKVQKFIMLKWHFLDLKKSPTLISRKKLAVEKF